jgi:prolyl oligopeptidase PreP (S9A serine peptidase family)
MTSAVTQKLLQCIQLQSPLFEELRLTSRRRNLISMRIEPKAGHGAGKPVAKQIEEFTDVYSFLFWQLGMKD